MSQTPDDQMRAEAEKIVADIRISTTGEKDAVERTHSCVSVPDRVIAAILAFGKRWYAKGGDAVVEVLAHPNDTEKGNP